MRPGLFNVASAKAITLVIWRMSSARRHAVVRQSDVFKSFRRIAQGAAGSVSDRGDKMAKIRVVSVKVSSWHLKIIGFLSTRLQEFA